MLNKIRNLNFGYFVLVFCVVSIAAGLKMQSGTVEKTLLCFDAGCVHVQGASNVVLGIILFIIGVVMIAQGHHSPGPNRWWPLPKKTTRGKRFSKFVRHLFVTDKSETLTHENE